MRIKKLTLIGAFALPWALSPVTAHAGGMPTIDFPAIAQQLQAYLQKAKDYVTQNKQLIQMQQQFQQLKQQYDQMKQQVAAVKGTYDYGMKLYGDVKGYYDAVPKNFQDLKDLAGIGAYGDLARKLAEDLRTLDAKRFSDGHYGRMYERSVTATRNAIVVSEETFNELGKHQKKLADLISRVDSAATMKEAQDLSNAINVEIGLISTAQGRIQAAATNVQGIMNNRNDQAVQDMQLRYEAYLAAYEAEYGSINRGGTSGAEFEYEDEGEYTLAPSSD